MKNERSLEGEIRLALARQYPAGTTSPEILQPATVAEGMWRASARPV
jgi:hypothetical protein